ncbi:MAG TPA: 6,7-dimethyl-8-ribityllumazine synthase [Acidimicrobiia bacterium]|nr:6,7-dimethyl-8-ribityllumazine synthase [Acidimicrobiia bacterium]
MPEISGELDASQLRIGIAVADFNGAITRGLLSGAMEVLASAGAPDPLVVVVPGAFELPVAARGLIDAGCDAVIALGAVILGETDHYHHVATQAASGLQQVSVATGVPVAFGVLTAQNASQAAERSAPGPANKGAEAAEAAVRTANALRGLRTEGGGGPAE